MLAHDRRLPDRRFPGRHRGTRRRRREKTADALYLVDGSGFIFRAFHALPPLTRSDGTPVNAVMGFTNMLMKLLAVDHADSALAVIFDSSG